MAGKIQGVDVSFGADTVTFDNSISGMNRALGVLSRNIKNSRKELRFDSGNIDSLQSKFDNLNKHIEVNKKRLELFKQELNELDDSEIGSAKWATLTKQINSAESEIKQMTAEAKKTEEQLNEIENSKVDVDASDAKKELDQVANKAEKSAEKIDKIGQGIQTAGKIASVAGAAIAGGLAVGISGASDLTEAINAAQNQFGDFTNEMLSFTANSAVTFGESQATVLEYASAFKRVGMSNEQIQTLLLRTTDIASEQNKTFEEVGDMMISVYNGSTEAGEKYGIQTKVNQLGQYMFERGLASTAKEGEKMVGAMSTAEKQLLMYNKVMDDTSASQGDFAANSGTLAIEQKKLSASVQTLTSELGAQLLPIITPLIEKITHFVQSISRLDEQHKKLIVTVGLIIIALGPLLIIMGKLVSAFAAIQTAAIAAEISIAALVAPVIAVIAIIAALVAAFIYAYQNSQLFRDGVNQLIDTIKTLVKDVLTTLVSFYNTYLQPMFVALAEVVGKVVVDSMNFLIDVINQVLMPILMQLWDFFKANILPIFQDLALFITGVVVPAFSQLWDFIAAYILPVILELWTWIANKVVPILTALGSIIFGSIRSAFNVFYTVITTVIGVISSLIGWIGDLWNKFNDSAPIQFIKNGFQGLKDIIDGIVGSVQSAIGWFGNLAGKAGEVIGNIGSFLNPFDSGGYSFNSGGYGDVVLNATFNISQAAGSSSMNDAKRMAREMMNTIDEELGRRKLHG